MKHNPIHLVTGGDSRFVPGIRVTVASALTGIPENNAVIFHILNGGLSDADQVDLRRLAECCHRHAELVFHTVTASALESFVPGPGNSRMYYARIGMASLLTDVHRAIYLDSDTLVMGDLSQLWNTDSSGAIVMACRDRKVTRLSEDSPWPLAPTEENLPYFNSGVMLVNLAKWRAENIEQQCLDLIAKPAGPYRWWDQTILNYLLKDRIESLSSEWNWQSAEVPTRAEKPIQILHYTTGTKPWLYWGDSFRFKAWRSCYRACTESPLLLFLQSGSQRGLVNGLFDGLLERSRILRHLYINLLKVSLKLSGNKEGAALLEQKTRFLTSPRKHRDLKNEEQLLKKFKQELRARMQPRQA